MRVIKLLPTTKKLKQRIKEHGDIWVAETPEPVTMECFNGGFGIRIRSIDGKHVRNVEIADFEVVIK